MSIWAMVDPRRTVSESTLDRIEIVGAVALSLLVVFPVVYVLTNRLASYAVDRLGIGTPLPL
jgi:ethanolamine transporter EutH